MTIAKDFAAKAVVAFVAAAMLLSLAPAAKAQSTEDLQAMINNLLAQIAALQSQVGQGGTSVASGICPFTWTRDLSQGSTGPDVMKLQQFLNADADTRVAASGAGSVGMETEFYGPATAAAVSKMQVKYRAEVLSPAGLVNPTGFFGPSSRAKANAVCAGAPVVVPPTTPVDPTTPTTPTTPGTGMSGSEANLTNFNFRSGEFTSVEEGATDVPVGEIEFDVKDGDIRVDRLDLVFDWKGTGSSADTEPWRVFRDVSIWVDGEKVATQRVDSRNDWSRNTPVTGQDRIRLTGLDIVYRQDDRSEIIVAVSAQSSVRDVAQAKWEIYVPKDGVRGRDGAGIDQFVGPANNELGRKPVEFNIEAEGKDDELRITRASSDPAAAVLELETDRTSNYMTVFAFELDTRDSTSDIEINSLIVGLETKTATSADVALTELANDVRLRVGSRTYSRSTLTATSSIFSFNDSEMVINRGQRATVEVQVRFRNMADSSVYQGSTIKGTIVSADVTAEGTRRLDTADIKGGATGETHTLLTQGLRLNMVKPTTQTLNLNSTTVSSSTGDFKLRLEVTAVGDTMYIPLTAIRNASGTVGVAYEIQDGNGAPVASNGTAVAALTRVSGGSIVSGNYVEINEGSTAVLELSVNYDPTTTGFYQVQMLTVGFRAGTVGLPNATRSMVPSQDFRSTSPLSIPN